MKSLSCSLLGVFIFFSVSTWGATDISKFLTKKAVEIEWDEVPFATEYQLEIYDGKNKKFLKTFISKTNIFKLNVKMGKYFFRSRIRDQFERTSEWTELAELVIAPPPTKIKSSLAFDEVNYTDKKTGVFNLPLEWEPLVGVESYKVLMEDPKGGIIKEYTVNGLKMDLQVPPGQFQFRVQAILPDGTMGDAGEPTTVLAVVGAKIQPPVIQYQRSRELGQLLEWTSELQNAVFDGTLFYKPLEGTSWVKVKDLAEVIDKTLSFDANFTPGLYRLRLQAKAKGFTPSDYSEQEFVVKPRVADLEAVLTGRHFFDDKH